MVFNNQFVEQLIFKQDKQVIRFTQDSPVYPDVWLEYFENGRDPQYRADLILTPHKNASAAELFQELSNRLRTVEIQDNDADWQLASSGDTVVAKLTLVELVVCALPITQWWRNNLFDKDNRPTGNYFWLAHILGALRYAAVADDSKRDQPLAAWYEIFENLFRYFPVERSENNIPITLWSVNRNRKATVSLEKSVPATKADAGRRLFDIDGSGIAWAIMDSGIDARHSAFRKTDKNTGKPFPSALGAKSDKYSNHSRVVATYDFTKFREVLTYVYTQQLANPTKRVTNSGIEILSSDKDNTGFSNSEISTYLTEIGYNLQNGRMLDWSIIAPLLRIAHNESEYQPPLHPHGTHVAGIVGANQAAEESIAALIGMCPGIDLYDIRVMDAQGEGQEFNILAAIQFIRWFNNQKDNIAIHGVNMSFSMTHDVASFACGQTPVCVAAERLVTDGCCVVVAAGNLGQTMYQSKDGVMSQGFRMVNITDPGNAERVITVGATHRNQPHAYGVSYFSSKGPTGDGRIKPDLVAPGEKIVSSSLEDSVETMDGTSMAAPHVSGAAALILAKHRELIGKPETIKSILCQSATDLGREKYFQGCGMLDVLRAIQLV